jgi:hypothetical protein
MANKERRINSVLGNGNLGQRLLPLLLEDFFHMSTLNTVLAVSQFDPRQHPLSGLARGGIVDVSPTNKQLDTIRARFDDTDEKFYQQAYRGIIDRMMQAQGELQVQGNVLVVSDLDWLPILHKQLRDAKEQFPMHRFTVLTALPESKAERGANNENIIPVCELLAQLQQEGIIEGSILLDFLSPLAEHGQTYFLQLCSKTIVGLMSAPFHSIHNPPFAEIIQRACSLSPCIGLATESNKIAISDMPRLLKFMRRVAPLTPERGVGDLNDAVSKSRTATRNVIEQDATLASAYPVDTTSSFFLLYIHPFASKEQRQEYENLMSKFTHTYDNARTLSVCANGTVDDDRGHGLYVQVAAVYPLAPELFGQLQLEKSLVPTPEKVQLNGHIRKSKKAELPSARSEH